MPVYTGTRQDLAIEYHRYRCQSCARTFCEEIPFRYPGTRISERAAAWISAFLRFNIPISAVQKITRVQWDMIKPMQKEKDGTIVLSLKTTIEELSDYRSELEITHSHKNRKHSFLTPIKT